jgi:imidazolonepropionase-like amidohydrolase
VSLNAQPARLAVRAGVYTRISSDPSGQRAGVERQRTDCEAYCLARGWHVAELFEAATRRPQAANRAGPMSACSLRSSPAGSTRL